MLDGSVAAQSHLGLLDDTLLTATEVADLPTRITARSVLPLIVDEAGRRIHATGKRCKAFPVPADPQSFRSHQAPGMSGISR